MRVGLTLYGDLDHRSGGFRYDRELVAGLRAAGDTVDVIELPWRAYPRGLLDNGSRALRRRLSVDVDVMLQDELAHPSLVRTNRHLPYPIVSVVHHLRCRESRRLALLYRAVERRYLHTVDGVVCNSVPTLDSVHDLGVRPPSVVAPPAGDRFDPDPEILTDGDGRYTGDGPLRVCFVGTVTPRKGLDTLVEGVARADADVELTVVGRLADADHVAAVRRAVDRHGLGDRVRILGERPDAALASVLASTHVLAVPSQYEGFGIVYLEGMSYGLPVLATTAGGASDIVDGETGVLVPPDDPAAVGRALADLASDPDRVAELGAAARRRYERHPDWSETTDRIRDFLVTVASGEATA